MTTAKYQRAWYGKNRKRVTADNRKKYAEDEEYRQRVRAKNASYYQRMDIAILMVQRARKRARAAGLECSITNNDFEIPEYCPILGIKLERGAGPASPSLDRIDNSRGYVPGNIQVVSRRANTMKSDASSKELAAFVRYWGQRFGLL